MTSNNYITILGWMTNLDIKGNELLVYAIIHGFSQDKDSYFHGSIKYLTEWTKTSEVCIIDVLKRLIEKGLLQKVQRDGQTNLYRTINPFEESVQPTEEISEVKNTLKIKKPKVDKTVDPGVEEILDYLNTKIGSRYRASTPSTAKLVRSKLDSGYTVDDFKTVIDNKVSDWLENEEYCKYLRPATLFGNKFESYLNQRKVSKPSIVNINPNAKVATEKPKINTEYVY